MENIKKSSEMPEPQVLDYWKFYQVTPAFMKDLKSVLGDIAYADAKPFFDTLSENNNELSAAQLTEFVRKLSSLPYKYVKDIMGVINTKEGSNAYFIEIKKNPDDVKGTK